MVNIQDVIAGKEVPKKLTDDIKDEIKRAKERDDFKAMIDGERYYKQKNTVIMERRKQYYADKSGVLRDDPYKANHKLPNGFMKLLTKQKVGNSINENMTVDEQIYDYFPDFDLMLKDICIEASKKGKAHWQFYISGNELKAKKIPTEQVFMVHNTDGMLEAVIREFHQNGVEMVYLYTKDLRIEMVRDKNGLHILRASSVSNAEIKAGSEIDKLPLDWGMPPFATLRNNSDCETDLQPIKPYSDIYDIVNSDFANNIDDFQDVYWIVKNAGADVEEFLSSVKKFKSIPVDEDGGAEAKTIDIPVEARKEFLAMTEKLIYKFGMGVNYDEIKGDTTNLTIKAMYANLNAKSNDFEIEINMFMRQAEYFINKYNEFTGKPQITLEPIKFVRSMLLNEAELIDSLSKLAGLISQRTLFEKLPFNLDPDEEFKRIEAEQVTIKLGDEDGEGSEG